MDKSYLTTNSDGLYDLLSDSIDFEFTESPSIFTVNKDYIARPDKISIIYYGTDEYWWAICRANNLKYPFRASLTMRRSIYDQVDYNVITDLYLGRVILIPTISDVNNHLNKLKGL